MVNPSTEGMGAAVMIRVRTLGLGLAGALALGGAVLLSGAPALGASPSYSVKGLPEFGRCVAVGKKKGNWDTPRCTKSAPGHGNHEWYPGTGEEKKGFAFSIFEPKIESTEGTPFVMVCGAGTAKGEYTGEKTLTVKKLLLGNCRNPTVAGYEKYCQTAMASVGQIEVAELNGQIGFISKHKKRVGLDLSGKITFECGGANETLGKGLGTGTTHEVEGSAIGKTTPVDTMNTTKFTAAYEAKGGKQNPENFENEEKDTLRLVNTPFGSSETTFQPAVLIGPAELENEQPLEIRAKCKGPSC